MPTATMIFWAVALREAQEESGLSAVRAVSPELFSVEILPCGTGT